MEMKESNKQFDDVKASLHTEALKLADELDLIAGMIAIGDRIKWGQDSELMENVSVMIRRLVEEFDKLGKGDYME